LGKFIDLTGMRFDKLIVLKHDGKNKYGQSKWVCKCDCGNITIRNGSSLKGKNISSCGCAKGEIIKKNHGTVIDMIGKKFGRLTVISLSENITKRDSSRHYKCLCDCGKTVVVSGNNLRNSHTKSCGCYKTEIMKGNKRSLNNSNKIRNPTKEGFIGCLIGHYKRQSKRRKIEFNLNKELFISLVEGKCFYCGEYGTNTLNNGGRGGGIYKMFNYTGIDRINSDKGYVEGNVVSCCKVCNYAKSTTSQNNFFDWIVKVYEYSNLKERTK